MIIAILPIAISLIFFALGTLIWFALGLAERTAERLWFAEPKLFFVVVCAILLTVILPVSISVMLLRWAWRLERYQQHAYNALDNMQSQ